MSVSLDRSVPARAEWQGAHRWLTDLGVLFGHWHIVVLRCDVHGRLSAAIGPLPQLLRTHRRALHLQQHGLRLKDAKAQERLAHLLREPGYSNAFSGPSLCVQSPGLSPLEFIVLARSADAGMPASRLLIIRQTEIQGAVDRNYLRYRLGLTRAQADVLGRLMLGEDINAIALARGSPRETIRGYLRLIRRRLKCSSQAQLVAAAWAAVGHIPTSVDIRKRPLPAPLQDSNAPPSARMS